MSIGTGGTEQDKYSSSYKTPNYTQYTDNNFKGMLCYDFHYKVIN